MVGPRVSERVSAQQCTHTLGVEWFFPHRVPDEAPCSPAAGQPQVPKQTGKEGVSLVSGSQGGGRLTVGGQDWFLSCSLAACTWPCPHRG